MRSAATPKPISITAKINWSTISNMGNQLAAIPAVASRPGNISA